MAQGVGNLSIGIGQGSAQVFNPSPAIAQYGQILAQKQAKHDAEVKDLAETLARGYDPSGLRSDTERQYYIKTYNGIKDDAIKFENEKDPTKRAMGLAQIRQRLNDLGSFSEGSKNYAKNIEQAALKEHALHPYNVSDDTYKKLIAGKDMLWNDPNIPIKGWGDVQRGVDPHKVITDFKKFAKDSIQDQQWSNGTPGATYKVAGKTFQDLNKQRGLPLAGENGALEHALAYASTDDDLKMYLNQAYPNPPGDTPQQKLTSQLMQFMPTLGYDKGFYEYKQEPKEAYKPQEPVRYSRLQLYNLNKYGDPNGPAKADANSPTYVQDLSAKARDPQTQMDAYQQLNDIVASNSAYQHGIHISRNDDGTVDVTVPAKMKYKAATATEDAGRYIEKPAYTVKLDPKNQALHDTKFGEIFRDVTGDVSGAPSHILTPAGKGHVGAGHGEQPQNTRTITDSKGNSITGYPKNDKWYNAQTNKPIE